MRIKIDEDQVQDISHNEDIINQIAIEVLHMMLTIERMVVLSLALRQLLH